MYLKGFNFSLFSRNLDDKYEKKIQRCSYAKTKQAKQNKNSLWILEQAKKSRNDGAEKASNGHPKGIAWELEMTNKTAPLF